MLVANIEVSEFDQQLTRHGMNVKSLSVELLILNFTTTLSNTRLMQFATTCSQESEKPLVWAHLLWVTCSNLKSLFGEIQAFGSTINTYLIQPFSCCLQDTLILLYNHKMITN